MKSNYKIIKYDYTVLLTVGIMHMFENSIVTSSKNLRKILTLKIPLNGFEIMNIEYGLTYVPYRIK